MNNRRELSLFSITYVLVIFASVLSVSQFIWTYDGADRAFLEAPRWITLARGFAVVLFLVSLLFCSVSKIDGSHTFNLELWIAILAAYIFVRGLYVENGLPKITTFASYLVLSFWIHHLRHHKIGISAIQFPLQVLIYGSVFEAIFFPEFAFTESLSRFGVLLQFRRFGGLIGHPSLFAFLAFLYLVCVNSKRSRFWRIEFLLILFLLMLANTASVMICLPLLYFMDMKRNSQTQFLKILGIAAPIASFILLINVLSQKISNSAIMGSDALNSRPVIWHWAFIKWQESSLLGLSSQSQNYELGYSNSIYWLHAHNQVLQELLAGGLIRLSLTLIIFFNLWRFALRRLKESQPESMIAFILLVSQATSEIPFTFNTIDFRFFTFVLLLLFYFVNFEKKTV